MVEKTHILPPYFIKVIFTFMLMAGTSPNARFPGAKSEKPRRFISD